MAAAPIQHVLLDIEGTTCPVQFVSEVLFPYAAERLEEFLKEHAEEPAIEGLLREVELAWEQDPDPEAQALRGSPPADLPIATEHTPSSTRLANDNTPHASIYLQWLIQTDRKLSPLKELQGLIWEDGYRNGALQGPVYEDVPPALKRWRESGLLLSVYSSGSVKAQQLLYQHSSAGDLRHLFKYWFDTRIGSKLDSTSYERICAEIKSPCSHVLFISDSTNELKAAQAAGLSVLHSDRTSNPSSPAEHMPYASIRSFTSLNP